MTSHKVRNELGWTKRLPKQYINSILFDFYEGDGSINYSIPKNEPYLKFIVSYTSTRVMLEAIIKKVRSILGICFSIVEAGERTNKEGIRVQKDAWQASMNGLNKLL